jgi:hypothetical protein
MKHKLLICELLPWSVLVLAARLTAQMPAPSPGTQPAEPPAFPKFEDVTKGMEPHKGLFTLWYYPDSARDKDKEKLLCQVPSGFLGQKFMVSVSQSGGGCFPIDEHVVQWQILDKQLLLIEPQSRYVVDEKNTIYDVVQRSYPDRIIAAAAIMTKSPEGDPVIDLGALLKSDFAGIGGGFWFSFSGRGSRGINPSLSRWISRKTFELNVEISVNLAVGRSYPSGSYDQQRVHYSLWKLPTSDYKPRAADDRVGYFLTAQEDWAKPTDARDLFNRYVDRWHLVKRDPTLARCEPKEPITFYVEKTVPVKYRQAVREGILEWNKAFEKCGFVDAIQVRQQTEDNEYKDLDPEDMRYSFIRWIVTGMGFAMGPHRANPFTGQIYDADIVFDDSLVRYHAEEARDLLPSALVEMKMRDPALRRMFAHYPQWLRPDRGWEQYVIPGDPREPADKPSDEPFVVPATLDSYGQVCDYARGMKHQLILAQSVLGDQPPEVMDRLVFDVVKHVVTHEVGHTLGLRHNFKGSTVYTLDQIKARRRTGEATTGSIMDYNPITCTHDHPTEGSFLSPTLGPWDYWAIEYGYRPGDCKYEPPTGALPPRPAGEGAAKVAASPGTDDKSKELNLPAEVLDKLTAEQRKALLKSIGATTDGSKSAIDKQAKPADAKESPASKPAAITGEEAILKAIASRCNEPDLAYGTDEDATMMGPDPRVNRYDAGDDPIAWADDRIDLINERMANVLKWAVKDGESWYHLRRTFMHLMIEKTMVLDYVGRYIGGQYTNRSHRGDPNGKPPFELVDVQTQYRALAVIEKSLYSDEFFAIDADVLNHLTSPRWYHEGAYVSFVVGFRIHDLIRELQWWNLFDRLLPMTLQRIQDAELQSTAADKMTLAEYLTRLQAACWGRAVDSERRDGGRWSEREPFVSDTRRSLQREYLDLMEDWVRMRPGSMLSPDIHAMLQEQLRSLRGQIQKVLSQAASPIDAVSRGHLQACSSRIERILAPQLREYDMRFFFSEGFGESDSRQRDPASPAMTPMR